MGRTFRSWWGWRGTCLILVKFVVIIPQVNWTLQRFWFVFKVIPTIVLCKDLVVVLNQKADNTNDSFYNILLRNTVAILKSNKSQFNWIPIHGVSKPIIILKCVVLWTREGGRDFWVQEKMDKPISLKTLPIKKRINAAY